MEEATHCIWIFDPNLLTIKLMRSHVIVGHLKKKNHDFDYDPVF